VFPGLTDENVSDRGLSHFVLAPERSLSYLTRSVAGTDGPHIVLGELCQVMALAAVFVVGTVACATAWVVVLRVVTVGETAF